MGTLIVVGDGPEVLNICSGGFLLDAAFSPQRLSELAKMDGAIILASDASRIARANVHLVPDPNVPTSETGTRHRTAERVGAIDRHPGHLGVRGSVDHRGLHAQREAPARRHPSAAQPREPGAAGARALQDEARRRVGCSVRARGRRPRDVARRAVGLAAHRDGHAHRRRDRGYIVELGVDGRLVRLRSTSSSAGVEDDRRLVVRDYFADGDARSIEYLMNALGALDTDELVDLEERSPPRRFIPRGPRPTSTRRCSRGDTDCSAAIPRLPDPVIESVVERFGTLHKIMRATIDDLVDVEGVGTARASGDQGRPVPPRREQHPRPLLLTRRRSRPHAHRAPFRDAGRVRQARRRGLARSRDRARHLRVAAAVRRPLARLRRARLGHARRSPSPVAHWAMSTNASPRCATSTTTASSAISSQRDATATRPSASSGSAWEACTR